MKKSIKGWEKSQLEWNEYFKAGDEIDEETFLHIGETVSCEYSDEIFIQCGECSFTKENQDGSEIYYHSTAISIGKKYYYLGDMPSLNNE